MTAAAPEVSVVIPTRDRVGLLLTHALRAALAQEAVDLEVIVVDDGSRDRTQQELDALADARVRVLRNEWPAGVSGARNRGLEAARGSWVAFLDDDDLWAPTRLRTHVDAAEQAGAGFAYGAMLLVDAAHDPIAAYNAPDPATLGEAVRRHNALGGPANVTLRRALLDEVGGFDPDLEVLADWDLWLRVATRAAGVAVPEHAVAFVRHGGNSSVVNRRRVAGELDHIERKHGELFATGAGPDRAIVAAWLVEERRRVDPWGAAADAVRGAIVHRRPRLLARALGDRGSRAARPAWLDAYAGRPRRDGKAIGRADGATWTECEAATGPAPGVELLSAQGEAIGYSVTAGAPRTALGRRLEQRRLRRAVRTLRADDPGALVLCGVDPAVTLRLPFTDGLLVSPPRALDAAAEALAAGHALAEELPLLADLRAAGEGAAELLQLAWQSGCTGAVVAGAIGAPGPAPRPSVSVVVCTHNGARTLPECLDGLERLDYPEFEVIVVDDGSTDDSAAIARERGVQVISPGRVGLSRARNAGTAAAHGEIVAFIDDDASPHADWLSQLAGAFGDADVAGAGGPNIAFPEDGPVAACAASAPGRANYVMRGAFEAEHLTGISAFRRAALDQVGGFDPGCTPAGEEVDLCRRLRAVGWRLACAPGAVVFHHFRPSVRAYWRQQWRNGAGEAYLAAKRAAPLPPPPGRDWPRPLAARPLPTRPYLVCMSLLAAAPLARGRAAKPLRAAVLGATAALAATALDRAGATAPQRRPEPRPLLQALTALLYLIQPLARLGGRISEMPAATARARRTPQADRAEEAADGPR